MNEIEQMYRNAGLERKEESYCSPGYCIKKPSIKFADCETCRNCEKGHFYMMPEFTPSKQLEVIKVLAQKTNVIISFNHSIRCWKISTLKRGITGIKFDDVLANLVNAYWQDLTEAEKQKITNILKGEKDAEI